MHEMFELCNLIRMAGISLKYYSFINFIFQVFEELGILSKITPICGASAGAIAGTLLPVGCSPKELEKLLGENLEEILLGK